MKTIAKNQGLLITFEGIEGCGKSTQLKMTGSALQSLGYQVLITREPGGTKLGEAIRNILLNHKDLDICPMSELLLFAAARAQHVSEVIIPALEAKVIVLCDRYTDATLAYQSGGRKLNSTWVQTLNQKVTNQATADLTLLFDLEVKNAMLRVQKRKSPSGHDRIESLDTNFHENVRKAYLMLAEQNPQRIKIIDANPATDVVNQVVMKMIQQKLQQK